MRNNKGFANGIIAAISYGTNPLFALPMYSNGLDANSVLFYRYFFAVIIYGVWIKLHKRISFKISSKECLMLFCMAIIFSLSSLFLFEAFNYIEAGIACTILFAYPIMVAAISRIFFKEKFSWIIWGAMLTAIFGIYLLYGGKQNETLNIKGIIFVLLSSLMYAIYMVGIKQIKVLRRMKPDKLTFYVMLFGLSIYIWNLKFCMELKPIENPLVLTCAIMLALFPTIISLEAISIAIKLIGPTYTAILGVLEPLTAIFFGITLFNETLTLKIGIGIIIILLSVISVILNKQKQENKL